MMELAIFVLGIIMVFAQAQLFEIKDILKDIRDQK